MISFLLKTWFIANRYNIYLQIPLINDCLNSMFFSLLDNPAYSKPIISKKHDKIIMTILKIALYLMV